MGKIIIFHYYRSEFQQLFMMSFSSHLKICFYIVTSFLDTLYSLYSFQIILSILLIK